MPLLLLLFACIAARRSARNNPRVVQSDIRETTSLIDLLRKVCEWGGKIKMQKINQLSLPTPPNAVVTMCKACLWNVVPFDGFKFSNKATNRKDSILPADADRTNVKCKHLFSTKQGGVETLVPLRIKIPTLSPTATQTAHYERTSSSSRLRLPQFRCARKEAKNNPGKPETNCDTATQMVCSFRWNGGGSRSGSFAHCCQPLHYCTPNTPLLGSSKLGTPIIIIIISFGRGAGLGQFHVLYYHKIHIEHKCSARNWDNGGRNNNQH